MTAELHGQCHGCGHQRQLFCPNATPRPDDLLLCGECWMVRAFNDGLALSAARRDLEALRGSALEAPVATGPR